MKVACLMMLKNETLLLEPWILYHGAIFGFENLFVYDNGSTDFGVLKVLEQYQAMGVNIYKQYNLKEHFERKGNIFIEKIKSLEVEHDYNFFFPLDCDEFIVVEKNIGEICFDASTIFNELENCSGIESPLMIKAAYDNNPLFCNDFLRSPGQRKTFFYKNTCESLDIGFHEGKTRNGESPAKTNIVYIHYHYKPYDQYIQSAKQKLQGRVESFSYEDLIEFSDSKGPGYHLVGALLGGEQSYYDMHYRNFSTLKSSYYSLNAFQNYTNRLGVNYDVTDVLECYELNEPRWKGHVDRLEVNEHGITISGWVATVFSDDVIDQVIVNFEDFKIESNSISRTARPDVLNNVRYAKEYSGFVAKFEDVNVAKIDNTQIASVIIKSGYSHHTLNVGASYRSNKP